MKEIYILNKGDSIEKVKSELHLLGEYNISSDKILNKNYITIKDGVDDIILIKNYLPYFVYRVKENETLMDILSKGYDVHGIGSLNVNDIIVVSKPKSIRYIVGPLETLNSIAKKFGVDKDVIMVTNNLKTEKLFVGQILWI